MKILFIINGMRIFNKCKYVIYNYAKNRNSLLYFSIYIDVI